MECFSFSFITRTNECSIYLWRTRELFCMYGCLTNLEDESDIPTKNNECVRQRWIEDECVVFDLDWIDVL